LAARVAAGARRHWLIFGERNAAHDRLYADELDAWQRAGVLERLDLAFSREAGARHRYVQHVLRDTHDALRAWVHDGAAIYVCGSLRGMAPAVDQALSEALGAELTRSLQSQGRYRRDVY
ncbi:sulfite reductase flavoprotein subunit alpha, partial [Xanthomonas sp. Kuri4-2]